MRVFCGVARPALTLTTRHLNRALLARQGLLERSDAGVLDTVEHLVGMQAQEPENPYVALWSRLRDFEPQELSGLIAERRAVRTAVLRGTIHLVSARDCLAMHPLTLPLMAQLFRSSWQRRVGGAPVDEVATAGRELLEQGPRTRAELSAALGPRWPEGEAIALAYAVTYHLPLVQVPPRGLWKGRGQARWALVEQWLDEPPDGEGSAEALVLRYLAAFGPATVSDARIWSRLTGLREVFERLRPGLRTFRDEHGRELFDVPDGLLADPDVPAPPRFMPEYDNAMLGHADRSRLDGRGPGEPFPPGPTRGWLLVDGFYRANWHLADGTLHIDRFERRKGDPPGTEEAIEAEAAALAEFLQSGQ